MSKDKENELEKAIRSVRPTSGILKTPVSKETAGKINFAILTAAELKDQINELLESFNLEKKWLILIKRHIIKNWEQKKDEGSITYLKRIYPRILKIVQSLKILKNEEGGNVALIMMWKDKTSIKEKMNKLEDGEIEDILTSYGPF